MFVLNGIVYANEKSENIQVVSVKPLDDMMMILTFSTGEQRLFDATILTGLASAVAAGIFPLASIAAFLNICTLAYLIMLAYGLIRLRKEKGMPKAGEFKTPLVPLLPILSIIICLSFMLQYNMETWIAFLVALLVGSIIYFTYGYKHSTIEE